ncbi:MAG: T9SS type A sorting domain-containing protein [Flavobacteriales bacterium]|nr:T9SS type A sorting domain-containing protein [Flavobacteriales bacterium]
MNLHLRFPILFSACCLFIFATTGHSQIFVDATATGSNSGSSWVNAYTNLQTAINSSKSNDTIWVSNKTYFPTQQVGQSNRSKTFVLKDSIKLFGGFDGTETLLSERDLDKNGKTILSGDVGNTPNDSTDNALHVVVAVQLKSMYLDGFKIEYGYATLSGNDTLPSLQLLAKNAGGGIYFSKTEGAVANCDFYSNGANDFGGGVFCFSSKINFTNAKYWNNGVNGSNTSIGGGGAVFMDSSNLIFDDASFTQNRSIGLQGGGAIRSESSYALIKDSYFSMNYTLSGDGGGAVYNLNSTSDVMNTSFQDNFTNEEAGAMYNDGSIPEMSYCTFEGNSCGSGGGGALENDGGSHVIIKNSFFIKNDSKGDGGAIQNWKSSIILDHVEFVENSAVGNGGAISNYNECSPTLTNVTFSKNTSGNNGGAIYNSRRSNPIITNCLFAENSAAVSGGAFYNYSHSSPTGNGSSPVFTNVTIVNNTAKVNAGGGFDDGVGQTKVRNSIISGNKAPQDDDIKAPLTMMASAVFNDIIGNEYYANGSATPVVFTNKIFVDTALSNYKLATNSPAIDKGDSSFYSSSATPNLSHITNDLQGIDRIMGANIDLGAYESCAAQAPTTVTLMVSPNDTLKIGDTATFTAQASISMAGGTFLWFKNDTLIQSNYDSSISLVSGVNLNSLDSISVHFISAEVCVLDTARSNKVALFSCSTMAPTTVTLMVTPSDSIKSGDTAIFTAQASRNMNTGIFQWFKNDTLFQTNSDSSILRIAGTHFKSMDQFSVNFISSETCVFDTAHSNKAALIIWKKDTVTTPVDTSNGVDPNYDRNAISVYPNPNKGTFTIKGMQSHQSSVSIDVLTIDGKQVWKSTLNPENQIWEQSIELDNSLKRGIYILKVSGQNTRHIQKIIME